MKPEDRQRIKAAIDEIRADNQDVIAEQPDKATTPGQIELARKHGTPREFATACINAIGEISCMEAHFAIRDYRRKWEAA